MTAVGRRLVLARHARSEQFADSDHARPLTRRGHRDALAAGAALAREGWLPDHVVLSSAVRAQETWEALREGAGLTLEGHASDSFYSAGPDAVLDLLRELPAEVGTVLVVGHNPTMAWLAHALDDGEGDPEVLIRMSRDFAPASTAHLELQVAWADLVEGSARLVDYLVAGERD